MNSGERFLRIVDAYAGYCQSCNEPTTVGRIAVSGWSFHGAICSGCLAELANQVQRLANAITPNIAGNGKVLAACVGTRGASLAASLRANGNARDAAIVPAA